MLIAMKYRGARFGGMCERDLWGPMTRARQRLPGNRRQHRCLSRYLVNLHG